MLTADTYLIGGPIDIEGVLRRTRGQYWIRQGLRRVVIATELDLESRIGRMIRATGSRARSTRLGRKKDALWVTKTPRVFIGGFWI